MIPGGELDAAITGLSLRTFSITGLSLRQYIWGKQQFPGILGQGPSRDRALETISGGRKT